MSSISPEVIIDTYIDAIRPNFNYVVAITAFSACMVTLLVVLFAFSTKESRRRWVFLLNVFAICLCVILGIFNGVTSGKAVLDPFSPVSPNVYIATIVFAIVPPLIYDSILLTRLFALYPPATTPPSTLMKVFAFPFIVKCARVVCISFIIHQFVDAATSALALAQYAQDHWFRNPWMTAEWTLQMTDNLYSVSVFLYKLHTRTSTIKRASGITERLRQLFYISVANFVFPLLFNIGQIICITTSRSGSTGTMLLMVNDYVTVMGVLCATIWFSGLDWVRTRSEMLQDPYSHRSSSGRGHVAGKNSGSGIRITAEKSVTLAGTDSDPGSRTQSKQIATFPHDPMQFSLHPYVESKEHVPV
ncbi:hypothetical protein ID866_10238 [Astraeus odoratus]|nr:hypothetical protein ID866_10238 [Astraeus odoratus]